MHEIQVGNDELLEAGVRYKNGGKTEAIGSKGKGRKSNTAPNVKVEEVVEDIFERFEGRRWSISVDTELHIVKVGLSME